MSTAEAEIEEEEVETEEEEETEEPEPQPATRAKPKSAPKPKAKAKPKPPPLEGGWYQLDKFILSRATHLIGLASDPTRLCVMQLANGERSVNEIVAMLKSSQPAISHHISLLRSSELITAYREGKENFYKTTKKGNVLLKAAKIFVDFAVAQTEKETD